VSVNFSGADGINLIFVINFNADNFCKNFSYFLTEILTEKTSRRKHNAHCAETHNLELKKQLLALTASNS